MNKVVAAAPFTLPEHWLSDATRYGVVLTAHDATGRHLGAVTVNSAARAFELGDVVVRDKAMASKYTGRGWQGQLYRDAIAALARAIGQPVPAV